MNNNIILLPVTTKPHSVTHTKIPKTVRKLAAALMVKLNISQTDMSLVYLIGAGTEHTNQSALETWIMKKYDENTLSNMHSAPDQIYKDFVGYLDNKMNDHEW